MVVRPSEQEVDPGGSVSFEVTVRNTGNVVDEFTVQVLRDAAPWATVVPDRLSLFPGAQGTAQLQVTPPRLSATPVGPVPIGVQVTSREDPGSGLVEECSVSVGGYSEVTAAITPRNVRSSKVGYFRVRVENRGNAAVRSVLNATDPDEVLWLEFDNRELVVGPGQTVTARLRARARDPFWFGNSETRPFQVSVEPEGSTPINLDANLMQQGRLPNVLPRALAGLLALGALVAALFVMGGNKGSSPPATSVAGTASPATSAPTPTSTSTSTSTTRPTTTTARSATTSARTTTSTARR